MVPVDVVLDLWHIVLDVVLSLVLKTLVGYGGIVVDVLVILLVGLFSVLVFVAMWGRVLCGMCGSNGSRFWGHIEKDGPANDSSFDLCPLKILLCSLQPRYDTMYGGRYLY